MNFILQGFFLSFKINAQTTKLGYHPQALFENYPKWASVIPLTASNSAEFLQKGEWIEWAGLIQL